MPSIVLVTRAPPSARAFVVTSMMSYPGCSSRRWRWRSGTDRARLFMPCAIGAVLRRKNSPWGGVRSARLLDPPSEAPAHADQPLPSRRIDRLRRIRELEVRALLLVEQVDAIERHLELRVPI